jgi:hypothetical protein
VLGGVESVYALAMKAADDGKTITEATQDIAVTDSILYDQVWNTGRLLPSILHPDPAHLFVTGTGLTHLGSGSTRDSMHQKVVGAEESLSEALGLGDNEFVPWLVGAVM